MIVDQRMIDIIAGLHKELPILTTEELLEAKTLVSSPDPETASVGQSILYFSNFFERPRSIRYLMSTVKNLNDDGRTLNMILRSYHLKEEIKEDVESYNILAKENESD